MNKFYVQFDLENRNVENYTQCKYRALQRKSYVCSRFFIVGERQVDVQN